jgi:hypothetical protein
MLGAYLQKQVGGIQSHGILLALRVEIYEKLYRGVTPISRPGGRGIGLIGKAIDPVPYSQ